MAAALLTSKKRATARPSEAAEDVDAGRQGTHHVDEGHVLPAPEFRELAVGTRAPHPRSLPRPVFACGRIT